MLSKEEIEKAYKELESELDKLDETLKTAT